MTFCQQYPLITRSNVMTQGRPTGGWGWVEGQSGTTYHTTLTLDTNGFDAVRLIYALDNQDSCIVKACIAASATPSEQFTPITGQGTTANWVPVTFNNCGLAVDWHEQSMGQINASEAPILSRNLHPAPVIDRVPNLIGYTFSDWIPLASEHRSDGGRWPLLMHRTFATGKPRPGFAPGGLEATAWGGCYGGRILAGWHQVGDFVDHTSGFNPKGESGFYMPLAVQFQSRARGCTMMNIGDSIAGGVGAHGASFAHRLASKMSRPELPISCFTVPWGLKPGVDPTAYFPAAKGLLFAVKPSIVFAQPWSRNWQLSKSNIDLCFQEALKLGSAAEIFGGQSIYIAPPPCPETYRDGSEILRREIIDRLASLAEGGYLTYDPNSTNELGTGESPNSYQSWASDDQCHPNSAGHDWIANRLQEIIEPRLR